MQPERSAEVRGWLRKAANDLRGAEVDLAAFPPLPEDALFHCQQAVEKAMKAYLTSHDVAFKRTHDLDELAAQCELIDPSLHGFLDPARELTVFAWRSCYPGEPSEPDPEEAVAALDVARTAFQEETGRGMKSGAATDARHPVPEPGHGQADLWSSGWYSMRGGPV
jgi:HEPN domain-containing protein